LEKSTFLQEMKRRAGMLSNDDEEEDLFSDDSNDDDDELIGSSAENLKVFCCSSTEYQKMKNLLTDDGPPQVCTCDVKVYFELRNFRARKRARNQFMLGNVQEINSR
jgi:hypothetical protein